MDNPLTIQEFKLQLDSSRNDASELRELLSDERRKRMATEARAERLAAALAEIVARVAEWDSNQVGSIKTQRTRWLRLGEIAGRAALAATPAPETDPSALAEYHEAQYGKRLADPSAPDVELRERLYVAVKKWIDGLKLDEGLDPGETYWPNSEVVYQSDDIMLALPELGVAVFDALKPK